MKKRSVLHAPSSRHLFLLLTCAFLFRLVYGLCSEIWFIDQQQIYLIGLKFYATGQWPYFGADVAPGIQLPGALQGLVVGGPLMLFPLPEAPYLLLNLLSFAGLSLWALYCAKRLPHFPAWIIIGWLLTAPWVLHWSTNIDNDSYVIFGSCLFFLGWMETIPRLTKNWIPPARANALMGFGLFWDMQFHMSYVLLFPFVLFSLWQQFREKNPWTRLGGFIGGCITSGIWILPTLLRYGLHQGMGGSQGAITWNSGNLLALPEILARFLSLASCEIPRFIGAHLSDRLEFLRENWSLAPWAIIAGLLGILQTIALFLGWFQKKHPQKDWPQVKVLALSTLGLIYFSFLFAIKAPAAHTYYLTLPIAMLYGFYVFSPWVGHRWFFPLAKLLLVANILFHAGLAIHDMPEKSLYKDRGLFTRAIAEKNYQLLGERRPNTQY